VQNIQIRVFFYDSSNENRKLIAIERFKFQNTLNLGIVLYKYFPQPVFCI